SNLVIKTMFKDLPHIVYNFQSLVMILSFLVSLKLIKNSIIPNYMKGFFWYPAMGFLVLIPNFLALYFFPILVFPATTFNNLSVLFHYSFLTIFIINCLPKKRNIFLIILFVTFLILIIFILITKPLHNYNASAFAAANLGITIFSIIYYFQLFTNTPKINLRYEASFWIITGVFFCMSIHIPINGILDFVREKVSFKNLNLFASIGAFCYGVMHIFFIKAYICSIRPHKP
ncbi:MAG: hypothetical protein ABIO04_06035, partial [Ferruginibacter sp.]